MFRGGGRGGRGDLNRRGMAKSLSGAAATFMPPHVLAALAPAPPVAPLHTEAEATLREELREAAARSRAEAGLPPPRLTGLSNLLDVFEKEEPAPRPVPPTKEERKALRRSERVAAAAKVIEEGLAQWDPKAPEPRKTSDGYKTLFIARLAYETSAWKLQRELEQFGPVKKLRLVTDPLGASRGYAFVEFDNEEDLKKAYKRGDGMRIDGRRILVDVERGRTVKGWRPRRLGGGLGSSRPDLKRKPTRQEREGWLPPPTGCFSVIASLESKGIAAPGAAPAPAPAPRDRDRSRSRDRGIVAGDRAVASGRQRE